MKLRTEHENLYDRQLRAWGHETQEKIISTSCIFDSLNTITFEAIRNLTLLGFDTFIIKRDVNKQVAFFGPGILKGFDEQVTWLNSLNELTRVGLFKDNNAIKETDKEINFISLEMLKKEGNTLGSGVSFIYTSKYKDHSFVFIFKELKYSEGFGKFKEVVLKKLNNYKGLKDDVKETIKELMLNNHESKENLIENRLFGSILSRRVVDFIINPDDGCLLVFNYENMNLTEYKQR